MLSRIGVDDDRMRAAIARQHRENSMPAPEVEEMRAGGDVSDDAQERAGEEANQNVNARAKREVAIGAVKYD
jgi:hypothetical protein